MIILGVYIKTNQIESVRFEDGVLHVNLIAGRGWKWQNVTARKAMPIIREVERIERQSRY